MPDPPGSVYLMLPAALAPAPATAAVVWVGLLNVAAVVLTYLLAERYFGRRMAFAAGLLFAVNPWAVYFSRRSWAEIMPLFTVVALWAAYEVVVARRAQWAVVFFVALAAQVQVRILALIFGPAALLTVALWPLRWGFRWPALGIALGALMTAPYLAWIGLNWGDFAGKLAEGNRGWPRSRTTAPPSWCCGWEPVTACCRPAATWHPGWRRWGQPARALSGWLGCCCWLAA